MTRKLVTDFARYGEPLSADYWSGSATGQTRGTDVGASGFVGLKATAAPSTSVTFKPRADTLITGVSVWAADQAASGQPPMFTIGNGSLQYRMPLPAPTLQPGSPNCGGPLGPFILKGGTSLNIEFSEGGIVVVQMYGEEL